MLKVSIALKVIAGTEEGTFEINGKDYDQKHFIIRVNSDPIYLVEFVTDNETLIAWARTISEFVSTTNFDMLLMQYLNPTIKAAMTALHQQYIRNYLVVVGPNGYRRIVKLWEQEEEPRTQILTVVSRSTFMDTRRLFESV